MMIIGIMSDSHDRIENLQKAFEILKKENAQAIIHCGDFCAPFMIKELSRFQGAVHCVFGNTDDQFSSTKIALENGVNLHGAYAELELDSRKIAVTHYPFFANALAFTGKYDAVFYGHDHIAHKQQIKDTLLANPGNLAGIKEDARLAIYDTQDNSIRHMLLGE